MINQSMLTTIDNPYNPFTQFESWNQYDESQGYFTLSYLARITKTANELSPADNDQAIEDAMDEIVSLNILGIYKKISQ